MMPLLLEFIVRSSLVAGGTAVVLSILRVKTASVKHAAWAAVVVTMLALPIGLSVGARLSLPVWQPDVVTRSTATAAGARESSVLAPASAAGISTVPAQAASTLSSSRSIEWSAVFVGAYVAGAMILMLRLAVGTIQANRLRRSAVNREGQLTSERCITPITVGWFKPVLILPADWPSWPTDQLACVLTHEREHARRHDPLFQWLALLNRAVFWFHPLAWWLERRLAGLAEEACDTAVLTAGHSPSNYSAYLLEMARAVSRSGSRVHVGMAMPGAGLAVRMRQIVDGLRPTRLSRTRLICTVALCTASTALFASGTLTERDEQGPSQQAPAMKIAFEVVSIKPCEDTGAVGGRGGSASPRERSSPGYVSWGCVSLAMLIDEAWGGGTFPKNTLANTIRMPPGSREDAPKRVRGGPSWVDNDRWAIEIKLSGDSTDLTGSARHDAVRSAMVPELQAMILDRFQLKLRKATEEQPMYALGIAGSGVKITPVNTTRCYEISPEERAKTRMMPPPPSGFEGTLPCGYDGYSSSGGRKNGNESIEFTGIPMKDFAQWLSREMDRYVLDKTGLDGRFNFKLEFTADDSTPGIIQSRESFRRAGEQLWGRPAPEQVKGDGPTIFKALETLGLALQKTKGPSEYLLIESVQKPRPN